MKYYIGFFVAISIIIISGMIGCYLDIKKYNDAPFYWFLGIISGALSMFILIFN